MLTKLSLNVYTTTDGSWVNQASTKDKKKIQFHQTLLEKENVGQHCCFTNNSNVKYLVKMVYVFEISYCSHVNPRHQGHGQLNLYTLSGWIMLK